MRKKNKKLWRSELDLKSLPRHIAIIMDGNGRWAKRRGLSRIYGHQEGVKATKRVVRAVRQLEIPYLTLFALSTENLQRPKQELNALFDLLRQYVKTELDELVEHGIQLKTIGRLELLPKDIQKLVRFALERTKNCKDMTLTIALAYGARDEILRAVEKYARAPSRRLRERSFSQLLDTAQLPDPDLLIRTGGEMRVSNFLLWQIAYTELYFTRTLWPDFRRRHLLQAIKEYQRRERRFGLTSEQIQRNPFKNK